MARTLKNPGALSLHADMMAARTPEGVQEVRREAGAAMERARQAGAIADAFDFACVALDCHQRAAKLAQGADS